MKKAVVLLSVLAGLSLLAAPVIAVESEEKVELKDVPAVVTDAVKARFKDAELVAAAKETENDTLVYEVTVKVKGQNIDVTVTPLGAIAMIEKEISAKDLPAAVTKTLNSEFGKADYKIVEEITTVDKTTETLAYYEVLLTTDDKGAVEVQIAPDGKVANVEKKSSEEAAEN